jgi:putative membrane protein
MADSDKTLILCIDGDNDIGIKGKVKTPIIGRQTNLESATALAVSDPEEADANAMFGAVKLYDRMINQYPDESFEVATIAGSGRGGVEADRKMVKELGLVLKKYPADGVILVTDGFSDEDLVPIIQSRIPITSIHHVVVKHSERIEETYAIIFRYLRMLVEDPYYSRVALGVPGIILVIFGFLIASNQLENAGMVVTFVIGIVFVLKGFGLDERLAELQPRLPPPEKWINLITTGLGGIVILIGVIQGFDFAWRIIPLPIAPFWDLTYWATNSADIIGAFIIKATDMVTLGLAIAIAGDMVSVLVQDRKNPTVWNNMIGILFIVLMNPISKEAAFIIRNPGTEITVFSPLIIYILLGVVVMTVVITWVYRRFGRELFNRT